MKKVVILFVLLALGYFAYDQGYVSDGLDAVTGLSVGESSSNETITIANWNLKIFGPSKASNVTLLYEYANKIREYDIVFIQEIRDKSGEAFQDLCDIMPGYECMISSRAGTTNSKEQYGLLYRSHIDFVDAEDYNPYMQDFFERPPLRADFEIGGEEVSLYNLHAKPDNVQVELVNLEDLVEQDERLSIVIGDLNADCSYYNPEKGVELDSWEWIIGDDEDTTVSQTDCAYDRIIVENGLKERIVSYGIDSSVTLDESDHYLVWVELAD